MGAVDKVISIARAEVGYLEKASNSSLDSKTGNAGYNNYTKYAADLDKLGDIYNGSKNGYHWCDVFVDWCFIRAFGKELALKMLHQPKRSAGAGCPYSAGYYRSAGAWSTVPHVGDQIFFGSPGNEYHTGIVSKVSGGRVYTIEGNTSGGSGVVANGGGVFEKSYPIGSGQIAGYGRPNYKLAEEAMDLTRAETIKVFEEQWAKKNPTYHTLAQVPSYWREDVKEMMDAGIITGNSPTDLGLTRTEAKAAVISWRMHKLK